MGGGIHRDAFRLFIRDNGPGIPEKYHDRIFGLFQRLQGDSDGSGVGLSLVKRVIENLNGRVWVESAENRGATFWLALPTSMLLDSNGKTGENQDGGNHGRDTDPIPVGRG